MGELVVNYEEKYKKLFAGRGGSQLLALVQECRRRLDDPKNVAKGDWTDTDPEEAENWLYFEETEFVDALHGSDSGPHEALHELADLAISGIILLDVTFGDKWHRQCG